MRRRRGGGGNEVVGGVPSEYVIEESFDCRGAAIDIGEDGCRGEYNCKKSASFGTLLNEVGSVGERLRKLSS